jgi:fucose permease
MSKGSLSNVSDRPVNRLAISRTIAYYVVFIGLGLTASSLGPTLPGLAEHTQSNIGQISFLFTARSFGYLIGSFGGGRIYDRIPGHYLIGGLLLVLATTLALTPAVSLLWVLTAVLLILGIAEGTIDVGGNTLLVWVHQRGVGPYMNALHFFFGVGALLSPIVIAQTVLISGDINLAYWLLAIYCVPVSIWVLRLPSPRGFSEAHIETHKVSNPLVVGIISAFMVLYVGAEISFGGWLFTYATTLELANATTAAYLTSLFWGTFTAGRLLGIPIATRLTPQSMIGWDLVGCVLSMVAILLFPNSLTMLALGSAGLGLSMASIFPSILVYAERRLKLTGTMTSFFFLGSSTGAMTLPFLIGQLFEKYSPIVTMWAILFSLLGACAVFTLLLLTARKQARNQPD